MSASATITRYISRVILMLFTSWSHGCPFFSSRQPRIYLRSEPMKMIASPSREEWFVMGVQPHLTGVRGINSDPMHIQMFPADGRHRHLNHQRPPNVTSHDGQIPRVGVQACSICQLKLHIKLAKQWHGNAIAIEYFGSNRTTKCPSMLLGALGGQRARAPRLLL